VLGTNRHALKVTKTQKNRDSGHLNSRHGRAYSVHAHAAQCRATRTVRAPSTHGHARYACWNKGVSQVT